MFGLMQVTVGAAILHENKLLFVRQTYGDFDRTWTFPSGYVDAGEQADQAAVREAKEESGVDCQVRGLVSVLTMTDKDAPMLYLVFLCDYLGGEPCGDGSETDAARFFTWDEIAAFDEPFEKQNGYLARKILSNDYCLMRPVASREMWPTFISTYA